MIEVSITHPEKFNSQIESVDLSGVSTSVVGTNQVSFYGSVKILKKDGSTTTESAVNAAFFPGKYGFCILYSE